MTEVRALRDADVGSNYLKGEAEISDDLDEDGLTRFFFCTLLWISHWNETHHCRFDYIEFEKAFDSVLHPLDPCMLGFPAQVVDILKDITHVCIKSLPQGGNGLSGSRICKLINIVSCF